MKKVLLLALIVFATDANAYCSRGMSLDYNDTINNEFKYLICLHNEQNTSINQMRDVINKQYSALVDMENDLKRLQYRLDEAERQIEVLKSAN